MMASFGVVAVLLVATIGQTIAYETGAPVEACATMTPSHGAAAQAVASPFTVDLGQTCYKDGMKVQVYVRGGSNEFEGLFVQARDWDGSSVGAGAVGTFDFLQDEDLKTITCNSVAGSGLTHKKEGDYTTKTFTWTPPNGHTSDIKFQATVVKGKVEFWEGVMSGVVSLASNCTQTAVVMPPPNSSITVKPAATMTMLAVLTLLLKVLAN